MINSILIILKVRGIIKVPLKVRGIIKVLGKMSTSYFGEEFNSNVLLHVLAHPQL